MSRGGLKIAVRGLKALLRRDTHWFYRQFAQKSVGDQTYAKRNKADIEKAGLLLQRMSPKTFFYDLQTALIEETEWDPEITSQVNAVVLAGEETTQHFKYEIKREAERLGMPIVFAPAGDLFVPYASPETLLEILAEKTVGVDRV